SEILAALFLSHSQLPSSSHIFPLSLHDALPISDRGHECRPDRTTRCSRGIIRAPADAVRRAVSRLVQFAGGKRAITPRFVRFGRSEEHTSELQSRFDLVCRLPLEKKKQSEHEPE